MGQDFTSLYDSNQECLNAKACSSVSYARENAVVALQNIGMPTNRLEYWKYSRIAKVLNGLNLNVADSASDTLVSAPKDSAFEMYSLQEAIETKHPLVEKHLTQYAGVKDEGLTALNTACFSGGTFIHIPDNTDVKEPIRLVVPLHTTNSGIIHPRNLIVVGKNSSVTIIYEGPSDTQTAKALNNTVEEVVVGENANVKQFVLQNTGGNEVNSIYVNQESNSVYTRATVTLDGTFVRNNITVKMDGTGCESNLYGYYHIRGQSQVDNHTIIEHKKPDCVSNELYIGLLDDDASGIFNGRVLVHQDAQRTNAFQSNKNILLSDNATMNTKPELEIYADDVKCSHGATIGQVDPEALFYLQSRGISKKLAMSMLLQGFSIEVTDKITDDSFQEKIIELILERLNLS